MAGPDRIDMRQHREDALRARRKAIPAQQRVQPDDTSGRQVKPLHLICEAFRVATLQSVADEDYHGALPHNTA